MESPQVGGISMRKFAASICVAALFVISGCSPDSLVGSQSQESIQVGGDNTHNASGDNSHNASGDNSHNASGDNSHNASGDNSHNASGDNSHNASGDNSHN
jgi:hypothetical protein